MENHRKHLVLIAGEASGDQHGAHLVKALAELAPGMTFSGLGGPHMKKQGVVLYRDLTKMAVVGFVEVLKHYGEFKKSFDNIVTKICEIQPDAVILIDYPGFNLRLAKKLHGLRKQLPDNFKIIYYISPQIWAWKQNRIHLIKKCVDQMLVLFPFEKEWYARFHMDVQFVGHPLLEAMDHALSTSKDPADFLNALGFHDYQITIGLLPGSRAKEVERHLPIMLQSAQVLKKEFPMLQFLLIKAPTIEKSILEETVRRFPLKDLKIIDKDPYQAINACTLCLVCSGTATLETAILEKPMVVIYKTSFLTWALAKYLITIPYIALVNVIAQKHLVPECIQFDANPANIARELKNIFTDESKTEEMTSELKKVRALLGEGLEEGSASLRAAQVILESLR